MAGKALTVRVRIDGVRETLTAFGKLPKDANARLRERSQELARTLVPRIQAAAAAAPAPQARLVAKTVKAQRDRVPVVVAGGMRRLGRHRAPAYKLLFAAEFGMNKRTGWYFREKYNASWGHQYPAHAGTRGYWFFDTVDREGSTIGAKWRQLADDIARSFAAGGA